MDPILEAARKYGLAVVEDATESLGASYRERPVGHLGDIACFSFNGNKLITTGGGGMIVTDREDWARRAKYLTTQAKDDAIEFEHGAVGYNYRLTNVLAAMGVAQMEQLDGYIQAKRRIAATYREAFASVPGLAFLREAPWAFGTDWMSTVLIDAAAFGCDSRAALRHLESRGIQTRPLWQPLHRSAAHVPLCAGDVVVADRLNRDALTLPCSVGLTAEQQARVCEALVELSEGAPR
jgi:perosamine synthetase